MLTSVEGVYRNGKIELLEPAPADAGSRVIVTFLSAKSVDLSERGIDAAQAADLRQRFAAFAPDWDDPKMDAYDAV